MPIFTSTYVFELKQVLILISVDGCASQQIIGTRY